MTAQHCMRASVHIHPPISPHIIKMASSRFFLASAAAILIAVIVVLDQANEATAEPGHHGHGHHKGADGTACIVKGSYCSCHYCKCEKGWVWCGHKKHGGLQKLDYNIFLCFLFLKFNASSSIHICLYLFFFRQEVLLRIH